MAITKRYKVTMYFSEIYEVEASDENEAQRKAENEYQGMNVRMIPDEIEVKCLDEE